MTLSTLMQRIGHATRRALTVLLGAPLLFVIAMVSQNLAGALPLAALVALTQWYVPVLALQAALLVAAASVTGVYGGVPVTRFMLRVFPLRAGPGRRWGVVVALLLGASVLSVGLVWMNLHPTPRPGLPPLPSALATLTGAVVVWVQVVCAISLYGRRGPAVPSPSVLYLRRFRSFSDRVVYRALLAAVPAGTCVATLVPATGGPRDLDPLTIGFAGLRFRHPLRGIPRTHVCPDAQWQQRVTEMMQAADGIVIDGSADSSSMQFEYRQIELLGLGPRTVVVVDAAHANSAPAFQGAACVVYRRSLAAALPRALLWLLLFALYGLANWYDPRVYPMVGALGFLLMVPALLQKSVDRASTRALRAQLACRVAVAASVGLRPLLGRALLVGTLAAGGLLLAQRLLLDRALLGNDASAWASRQAWTRTTEVRIGDRSITLPIPAGFIDASTIVTSTRIAGETFVAAGERHLAAFVPQGYVARALFDDRARLEANMLVRTPIEWEDKTVDDETLAELKVEFAQAFVPGQPEVPVHSEALQSAGVTVQGMRPLGVFDERSRSISVQVVASIRADRGNVRLERTKTCSQTLARARGKLLTLSLCRDFESDADTAWVQALTQRWLEQLSAQN